MYAEDLDDQAVDNYQYDAIGNLVQDNQAGISAIEWTVYGKISRIVKSSGMEITYGYDASGNRISKSVKGANNTVSHTWYVRDASGNVMSTYNSTGTAESVPSQLTQTDVHLYGSSRLGVMNLYRDAKRPYGEVEDISSERGRKLFEISNHLGNVLATVSDKKIAHSTDGTTVDYFDADLVTANDYYPFGMLLPGRQLGQGVNIPGGTSSGSSTVNGYTLPVDLMVTSRSGSLPAEYVAAGNVAFDGEFESMEDDEFTAYIADESYAGTGNMGSGLSATGGLYKYGFNGKENDNEVKGTGNQQDYGMRIYDPRIGKFLSVDPLYRDYPWNSNYAYAENSPIAFIDLDGAERSPAGKKGVFAIDATAVQHYPDAIPVIMQQQADAPRNKMMNAMARAARQTPTISNPEKLTPFEQERHEIAKRQLYDLAGYNDDGSEKPGTKLARNKTWNAFANNLAFPVIDGVSLATGAGELKYLLTRRAIISTVDDLLKGAVNSVKALDKEAVIGYRGSLATGEKYSTGARFDPADFDVDAFIVSDDLAEKFSTSGFRNGRDIKELRSLSSELEESFKNMGGYRTDAKKPFTFRIFTKKEFEATVKPNGYKVLNP